MDDTVTDILRAADRHPNSKVSKLVHLVEEEPSQKNIVMLLIELSDHPEYATDFNISLRYYLQMFERIGIERDLILNEAGLLLVNSSKIYSKRVDYVQSLVERQIMTLSNADNELQQEQQQRNQPESSAQPEASSPAERPKRGRKRALDAPTDPYEVQLEPKKFKKLTHDRRFAIIKTPLKMKTQFRNVEIEQQIHPAGWKYATIYDLENEEDVDTKRNYKLFTYYVEHRYNTLVPDINFRLHFKVKDYMDAQEDLDADAENPVMQEVWPTQTEDFVRKYISLENHVLQQEIDPTMPYQSPSRNSENDGPSDEEIIMEALGAQFLRDMQNLDDDSQFVDIFVEGENVTTGECSLGTNDSGLGVSGLESTLGLSVLESTLDGNTSHPKDITLSENEIQQQKAATSIIEGEMDQSLNNQSQNETAYDSALGESILDQSADITNKTATELNGTIDLETIAATELNGTPDPKTITAAATDLNGTTDPDTIIALINSTNNIEKDGENDDGLGSEMVDLLVSKDIDIETLLSLTTVITPNNNNSEGGGEICSKQISEENHKQSIKSANENDKSPDTVETLGKNGSVNSKENVTVELVVKTEMVDESLTNSYQVEIEVVNEDGKAESNTVQIQIPSSADDEGVHLSEAYEDDFKLLTPSFKKELQEVLDLDNMDNPCPEQTYTLPVITEPKVQPLVLNILRLPPKLLKRKTLFKLGPCMELFLKARMQKPERPPREPPRTHRVLQYFPLNDMDMSGVLETPPQSPGHVSEFLGFSDIDDDADTICGEFCGFTEDEQRTIMHHRLSRDSGVGVDNATLTPDKDPVDIILEEIASANCSQDLNRVLTGAEISIGMVRPSTDESTEDLLNNLPADLRDVLQAEIEESPECTNNNSDNNLSENIASTKSHQVIENNSIINSSEQRTEEVNKASDIEKALIDEITNVIHNLPISEDISIDVSIVPDVDSSLTTTQDDIQSVQPVDSNSAIQSEQPADSNSAIQSEQPADSNSAIQSEQPADSNSATTQNDLLKVQSLDSISAKPQEDIGNVQPVDSISCAEPDNEVLSLENVNDLNIEVHNDSESQSNQQDMSFLDLDKQVAKTKIQQWHEHLRPILAKSRERHHFDVFELGSEIIQTVGLTEDNLEEEDAPTTSTFGDIMDTKDKSYVSRYFLSTLLLANQGNISVNVENKSSEMPSLWSDIHLQLISTKRHTVAIEDNIGMIDERKRKLDMNSNANESQNKKKKTLEQNQNHHVNDTHDTQQQEEESSNSNSSSGGSSYEENRRPLINLNVKKFPKKRPLIEEIINQKRSVTSVNESPPHKTLAASQVLLPSMDFINTMPSTSHQSVFSLHENSEFKLNQIRLLKPIQRVARQGDDFDSGIFSVDELSAS